MPSSILTEFQPYKLYFGDLHNHCDVSYGHGPLADAMRNARLQLDFTSITVHAAWPDLPLGDPKLDYLVAYHQMGFARAAENWAGYLRAVEEANQEGHFITFPSYEWHSIEYGDYCVYFKNGRNAPIFDAASLPELRQVAKQFPTPVFLIPHHIGYKRGSRGINWEAFSSELSPVAEIFSFHGLSESDEGPYPYLHSMGPRHGKSTAQYGWVQGNIFGVIASTDHHNAFPGSYGYGRVGVWAESLTRDAIWDAIAQRRTYAITGDRIGLAFSVNHLPIGAVCAPDLERWIEVEVCGSSALDYIEILHNNRVIHRESVFPPENPEPETGPFTSKVYIELGWGEGFDQAAWDVDVEILGGRLGQVEPHFRGYGPTASPKDDAFAPSSWEQAEPNRVQLHTLTRPNPSLHTAATEGMVLEIQGTLDTRLRTQVNGQVFELPVSELLEGSRTFPMGGFVSPVVCFHRAVLKPEYTHRFAFLHRSQSGQRDWYYARVRQKNDQWAWSSPIWVEYG